MNPWNTYNITFLVEKITDGMPYANEETVTGYISSGTPMESDMRDFIIKEMTHLTKLKNNIKNIRYQMVV